MGTPVWSAGALEGYEAALSIMGQTRGSYSKMDEDATFMRLKEDHMRNGQLKPAYNVQVAVNSEYITGIEGFSDRTDVKTLKPFLRRLEGFRQARYEEVVADAGYESLENYLYLDTTGQVCLIEPANYGQKKRKKFQKQIGGWKTWHMTRRKTVLPAPRAGNFPSAGSARRRDGQLVSTAWYRCENCAGCPCRSQCCRARDPKQPKELCLQKTFWEKRAEATRRTTSERGVHLPALVPLHPGGGGLCPAENRLWVPQVSHQRQGQHPR